MVINKLFKGPVYCCSLRIVDTTPYIRHLVVAFVKSVCLLLELPRINKEETMEVHYNNTLT